MRKFICIVFIAFSSVVSFAQNTPAVAAPTDWTKGERAEVYEECKTVLAKYPSLTEEQKKSVALEYMKAITTKYSKSEWKAMIDIELERIQNATIISAAKNVGVELTLAKDEPKAAVKETGLTSANMEGTWTFEEGKYNFTDGGVYILEIGSKTCRGRWALDGKVLTITPDGGLQKAFGVCNAERFDLMNPNPTDFSCMSGKKVLHFKKEKK